MKNLSVSDIIYVLDRRTHTVVPCQIVEIVSSKTLEGETVKHIVSTPSTNKKFTLEEQKNPWFDSFDTAKDYLETAALRLVQETMKKTQEMTMTYYGKDIGDCESNENVSVENLPFVEEPISPENELPLDESADVYVDMMGQTVKVTLPKVLIDE